MPDKIKDLSKITPELIEAIGKAERENFTHKVKTLTDFWTKNPSLNFTDVMQGLKEEASNKGWIMCC